MEDMDKADYGNAHVILVFCKGETLPALLGGFTSMPVIGDCAKGICILLRTGVFPDLDLIMMMLLIDSTMIL
jgi:hypothetical protein